MPTLPFLAWGLVELTGLGVFWFYGPVLVFGVFPLAEALNIHGTPGFIIGNRIVPGALDLDAMKNMIADARKS